MSALCFLPRGWRWRRVSAGRRGQGPWAAVTLTGPLWASRPRREESGGPRGAGGTENGKEAHRRPRTAPRAPLENVYPRRRLWLEQAARTPVRSKKGAEGRLGLSAVCPLLPPASKELDGHSVNGEQQAEPRPCPAPHLGTGRAGRSSSLWPCATLPLGTRCLLPSAPSVPTPHPCPPPSLLTLHPTEPRFLAAWRIPAGCQPGTWVAVSTKRQDLLTATRATSSVPQDVCGLIRVSK